MTSVSSNFQLHLTPLLFCKFFFFLSLIIIYCRSWLFYFINLTNSGIRDHIIAKSMCVCGDTNVLADDILPNKTLRDAINRIMESGNSSAENAGSMCQVQGKTQSLIHS